MSNVNSIIDTTTKNFANKISEKMKAGELTHEALAEHVGVCVDTVKRYKNGIRTCFASEFMAAYLCNIDIADLPFSEYPSADDLNSRKKIARKFGELLRAGRERKHMSRKALGQAVGLDASSIWRIEYGKRNACVIALYIAFVLNIHIDCSLFVGTDFIEESDKKIIEVEKKNSELEAEIAKLKTELKELKAENT